jgi:hypothetical protein
MILHDLIKSNHWMSVQLTLIRLYPDQEFIIDEYRNIFEKLQNSEPEIFDMKIVLHEYDCDSDDENENQTYVDVSGENDSKDEFGRTISHAIEFVEWKKWLGMGLAPETLKNFSELEIIAHCLYEMTFIGYDEEEIQDQFLSLSQTVEDFKNLTDEEKSQKTISLEDFLKKENDNCFPDNSNL